MPPTPPHPNPRCRPSPTRRAASSPGTRSQPSTRQPSARNRSVQALPMPRPAPVTSTVLFDGSTLFDGSALTFTIAVPFLGGSRASSEPFLAMVERCRQARSRAVPPRLRPRCPMCKPPLSPDYLPLQRGLFIRKNHASTGAQSSFLQTSPDTTQHTCNTSAPQLVRS